MNGSDSNSFLPEAHKDMDSELKLVSLDHIHVNPHQPRQHFSQVELSELADSIKRIGVIHPPIVRRISEDFYELIAGERRLRAARLAGLKETVVLVRQCSQSLSAEAALIENIQRVDLNPIEVAKALQSLVKEFGLSQEVLGQKMGKKRSTIANYLRLLMLPQNIQVAISSDQITMGHAKAILSLDDAQKQNLLLELILRDDLTVREAERAALRIAEKAKKRALPYVNRDFHLEQLAEKLQVKLGTKVDIQGKGKKGKISINYYSFEDLERVLDLFGVGE